MVGVDLSPGMLAQARTKGLYDRLDRKRDAGIFSPARQKSARRYHLVLAADVFMYFEDLAPVLNAVAQVLGIARPTRLQRGDA